MNKRIFPLFPQGPPDIACKDADLNTIVESYDGWDAVLDTAREIPDGLMDQLEKANYSSSELYMWRQVHSANERERVLFASACYGHLIATCTDKLMAELYEQSFDSLASARKNYDISYEDLTIAAQCVGPYM